MMLAISGCSEVVSWFEAVNDYIGLRKYRQDVFYFICLFGGLILIYI